MAEETLLEAEELVVELDAEEGLLKAVDGVSFKVGPGASLGIVGESGCGKSITVRAIMQLLPSNGRIARGRGGYRGRDGRSFDIAAEKPKGSVMRSLRGDELAMIFQEPMTSLSPIYTVGQQISESLMLHRRMTKRAAREKAIQLLERVHIAGADQRIDAYPHQLSGGMRQRVMIAIAIACNPRLLIADEPTTALDVTIEAQILELIKEMQDETGASLIMITHDLGVIGETVDDVVVMYVGRVVETGRTAEVLEDPQHPYTQALLRSIPRIGRRERLEPITGTVPSLLQLPKGCSFAPRCPAAMDICRAKEPPAIEVGPGRHVRCWLHHPEGQG